jgi:sarcosine oxidase subunit gamma
LGRDEEFEKVAKAFFGKVLPGPGHSTTGKEYDVHWTGPDQWFVEADFAGHELIAAELKDAFGATASVTEQTDGWARFKVTGPDVVDLLQRLCPIDSATMQVNQVTRTLIEHLGCFVICRAAGSEFDILGPRSAAASLLHALTGAAQSIA